LNGFFALRGGNLNEPIFKSSNARGVARRGGGMLNFRIDRRINLIYFNIENTQETQWLQLVDEF